MKLATALRLGFVPMSLILMLYLADTFGTHKWSDFVQAWPLWNQTLIIGSLFGAVLGLAGFWLLAENAVYTGLTVSAAAVLGLQITDFCLALSGLTLNPLATFTIAASLGLLFIQSATALSTHTSGRDAGNASAYLTALAGSILISDLISQGHHEMESLIFGNSVGLLPSDTLLAGIASFILLTVALQHNRHWLGLVFDSDFLSVQGMPTKSWRLSLTLMTAFSLIVGVKLFGLLTAFSIALFAPLAAVRLARSGRSGQLASFLFGALLFPTGFALSFLLDLPTGAMIAVTGFLMATLAGLIMSLKSRSINPNLFF
jgi:zinc transport system permease protein